MQAFFKLISPGPLSCQTRSVKASIVRAVDCVKNPGQAPGNGSQPERLTMRTGKRIQYAPGIPLPIPINRLNPDELLIMGHFSQPKLRG